MAFTLKDIVAASQDLGLKVVSEQDIADLVASGDLSRARRLSKTYSEKPTGIRGTDARAKREAAEKAKREVAEKAKREAAEKAKREADARAKREADEKAKREADARAKREADEKAKREADARAKREADEKAKREADARAKRATDRGLSAKAKKRNAKNEKKRQAKQPAQFKVCMQTKQTMDVTFDDLMYLVGNDDPDQIIRKLNENNVEIANYLEYLNVMVRLGDSEEKKQAAAKQQGALLTHLGEEYHRRHTTKSTIRLEGLGKSRFNICFESVALLEDTCSSEQAVANYLLYATDILAQLITNGQSVIAGDLTFVTQPECEQCAERQGYYQTLGRLHYCPIRGDGFCGYSVIMWALNVLYPGERVIEFESFFNKIADRTNNRDLREGVSSMALPQEITTVEDYFRDNCRVLPVEFWLKDELLAPISDAYRLTIVVVVPNFQAERSATTLQIYGKKNSQSDNQRIIYLQINNSSLGTSHFDLLVPLPPS